MENEELLKAREQIDKIDDRISELIEKRVKIAQDVVVMKKKNGFDIEDRNRESQIISRISSDKKAGKLIENVYKMIFDWVKSDQKK